jgi:hypothetical protein
MQSSPKLTFNLFVALSRRYSLSHRHNGRPCEHMEARTVHGLPELVVELPFFPRPLHYNNPVKLLETSQMRRG